MKNKTHILDLGTGKRWRKYNNEDLYKNNIVTCVDRSYYNSNINIMKKPGINFSCSDIISFLENTEKMFHIIIADRVFEHFSYDQIPYVLYLCKEVLYDGGKIEITVPNFQQVFDVVDQINYISDNPLDFNRKMIDVHTELFNTPNDPHRSIWTMHLATYYMEIEGFWKDIKISEVKLDNRDWYMKIEATKN